jgi:hypothetical protein
MKKILFLLTVSLVFGASAAAFAQTNSTTTSRIERRVQTLDQRIENQKTLLNRSTTIASSTIKEKIQERVAARVAKLTEARKEIITRFAKRMFDRIEAAIERQKKLADRIQERIAILKGKGINTASAETLLVQARTEITSAEQSLADAKAAAQSAVDADDPKTAFEAVRADVKNAVNSVKKTHQALVAVVVAIKGKSSGGTATSTATTTSE